MTDKPHKGTIEDWHTEPTLEGLGYYVYGQSVDHPEFAGNWMHTSWVVKRDGDEIETRNSRYTLGKPYVAKP